MMHVSKMKDSPVVDADAGAGAGRAQPRLLLVHGLIDENVHFRHTALLLNKLSDCRKRYSLVLFPKERHSPHGLQDRQYLEDILFDHLCAHLRPQSVVPGAAVAAAVGGLGDATGNGVTSGAVASASATADSSVSSTAAAVAVTAAMAAATAASIADELPRPPPSHEASAPLRSLL